ncbi:MAG: heparan-alpha-glucosaminide N-acetyltransferase domain-containing protein [Acidobacteriaceae bacterium]
MSRDTATLSRRIATVDLLRGLIMIVMALDHTRDLFSSATVDPTDPHTSWPMLFFTRWITHLCAPGFVALAGTSVYLQRQRGRTANATAKRLVLRGLWLIFIEVAVVSFGIFFTYRFHFLQVIYAIGGGMIVLAALQFLPTRLVAIYGFAVVALHNLLDNIGPQQLGHAAGAWKLLVSPGAFLDHGHLWILDSYPVLPWSGVMAIGYAFGAIVLLPAAKRRLRSMQYGLATLALFVALRLTNLYGDPVRFERLATPAQTAMSFLQLTKYPPSLDFICATLGILLLLFALGDYALEHLWSPRALGVVEIYGRVPFFYFILHFYILHLLVLAVLMASAHSLHIHIWRPIIDPAPPGWGFGLPVVYAIWIAVVAALYRPCKWFAAVKARRRDWWLSYL